MIIIGIDPGSISGAFAVLDSDAGAAWVDDLPVVDRQVDPGELHRIFMSAIGSGDPVVAVLENVSSHPHQGVASTFRFGVSVGMVRGVLASLDIPVHLVTPTKWKRHYNLGADKEKARALAIRYYPQVKGLYLHKHQGRAEALLMARWFKENGHA